MKSALRNEDDEFARTRWCDAVSSAGLLGKWGGDRFGSRLVDSRCARVVTSLERAFDPIRIVGPAMDGITETSGGN